MKMPRTVRERFRAHGAAGGRTRAANMSAARRSHAARHAVLHRWIRQRFGATRFELLGLPGGEIIDAGLADLAAGRETAESLLISLAAPRLRREGVPIPRNVFPDADMRLYRLLEKSNSELAHARYRAYLRQAESFADSCAAARLDTATNA